MAWEAWEIWEEWELWEDSKCLEWEVKQAHSLDLKINLEVCNNNKRLSLILIHLVANPVTCPWVAWEEWAEWAAAQWEDHLWLIQVSAAELLASSLNSLHL